MGAQISNSIPTQTPVLTYITPKRLHKYTLINIFPNNKFYLKRPTEFVLTELKDFVHLNYFYIIIYH